MVGERRAHGQRIDLEKLPFDAKEPRYLMLAREIVREIRSAPIRSARCCRRNPN